MTARRLRMAAEKEGAQIGVVYDVPRAAEHGGRARLILIRGDEDIVIAGRALQSEDPMTSLALLDEPFLPGQILDHGLTRHGAHDLPAQRVVAHHPFVMIIGVGRPPRDPFMKKFFDIESKRGERPVHSVRLQRVHEIRHGGQYSAGDPEG